MTPKAVIITWLIIFTFLFFIPVFNKSSSSNQPRVSKQYQDAVGTLNVINDERAGKGLPSLQINENLCAFARKKALDLNKKSPNPTLAEEFNDPTNKIYFSEFSSVVLDSIENGALVTGKELGKTFMEREGKGAVTKNITHGCVADSTGSDSGMGTLFTVFVGGLKKSN